MVTKQVTEESVREFRDCLGSFATGVAVVTCVDERCQPQGVTANSFSSVSLDPPLVVWSIANTSDVLSTYLGAQYYSFNFLTNAQADLSNHFAQPEQDLFESVAHSYSEFGTPRLEESLAYIECEQYAVHETGDHFIIIGRVQGFATSTGQPLLFYQGSYGEFSLPPQ